MLLFSVLLQFEGSEEQVVLHVQETCVVYLLVLAVVVLQMNNGPPGPHELQAQDSHKGVFFQWHFLNGLLFPRHGRRLGGQRGWALSSGRLVIDPKANPFIASVGWDVWEAFFTWDR